MMLFKHMTLFYTYLWIYLTNTVQCKQFLKKALKNTLVTNGLKRACTKKNLLYKAFIVMRSAEVEQTYKTYKHKLTYILRIKERKKLL